MSGWSEYITGCRKFEDLPEASRAYVDTVEEVLERPVAFISVGPERNDIIVHNTRIDGLG